MLDMLKEYLNHETVKNCYSYHDNWLPLNLFVR